MKLRWNQLILAAALGATVFSRYQAAPRSGRAAGPKAGAPAVKPDAARTFERDDSVYDQVKDETLPQMQDFLADTKAIVYTFARLQATTDADGRLIRLTVPEAKVVIER